MKGIIFRIKNGILRRNSFFINISIFTLLFSILFSSLYIDSVSDNMEKDIFSNFDIYATIISDARNEKSKPIKEYVDYIEEFKQMVFDLSENGSSSYYDVSYTSGNMNPIYPLKIVNGNISVLYSEFNNSKESTYNRENQCMNSSNSCIVVFPKLSATLNEIPSDFHFGETTLSKGRYFTKEEIDNGSNVCIVPDGSVIYDGITPHYLDVGDTVIISEMVQDADGTILYYEEYEYEVIGLYGITNGAKYIEHDTVTGTITYLPYKQLDSLWYSVIEHILEYNPEYYNTLYGMKTVYVNPAYFRFDEINSLQEFMKVLDKYESKFLENEYRYSTTIDDTFPSISNILSVSTSFSYISITVLAICIVLTIFIIFFELNTRKEEIGLLLSLGESYRKIVIQFVIELFVSLSIAIFISLFMTKIIGTFTLEYLMNQDVSSMMLDIQQLKEILQIDFDFKTILSFISFTLLIVFADICFITVFVKKIRINNLLRSE